MNWVSKLLVILATSIFSSAPTISASALREESKISTSGTPVFPFGESGLCLQDCPSIGSRAVVDYLSVTVQGQNSTPGPRASLAAGGTVLILYLGIDNGGYSNWWEAKATLVQDATGVRANLGKGSSSDGNDLKSINISCDRSFNKCNPSVSWQLIRLDNKFPVGTYSLEVEFTPFAGSGLPVVTHLFGPAVLTVSPSIAPETSTPTSKALDGRPCVKPGQTRMFQGVRYACVKSGTKRVWKKMA